MITKLKRYFWNNVIALDQLLNALTGGDPDETVSSRIAKRVDDQRWAYWFCRLAHLFDAGHCRKVREDDEGARDVIK